MRVVLLLLATAVLSGFVVGGEVKPPTAAAPKIAVLRLDEVILHCKFYTTRFEVLSKEKDDFEAQLKQMDEQLKQLDGALQGLSPSNEHFAKYDEDFETLKVRKKMTAERAQRELERHHGQLLRQTFDVLRAQLKDYCHENTIMMVQLAPNPDMRKSSFSAELQLDLQSVLYYDQSLDITEVFIAYVNGRFAAETPLTPPADAKAPATGPAPAPSPSPAPAPLAPPAGAPGQPTGK